MTRNPTTNEEGALLVKKLLDEATPVLAYLIGGDGSHGKVQGFVDSFTSEVGLVVSATKGLPSTADNLCLFLGSSDNLTYFFGDEREIPEPSREEAVGKYGNTILTVLAVSSGSFMVLYFNSWFLFQTVALPSGGIHCCPAKSTPIVDVKRESI
jgi:hypothetical protein